MVINNPTSEKLNTNCIMQNCTEETFKLVQKGWVKTGKGKVEYRWMFEGGWWMSGATHDLIWKDGDLIRETPRPDIGLYRNKDTREITHFFLPPKSRNTLPVSKNRIK